jgi:lipoteichoic acid synthase
MQGRKQLLLWPIQYIDFIWFFLSISLKLYLFGKFTGLPFLNMDLVWITIGSVILVSCWTFLLPIRARWVTLWALNLAVSFVIFSDVVYYRYFNDFITVPVILQAGQVGAIGGSIISLIMWQDIVFFLDVCLAALLLIGIRRKRAILPRSRFWVRISIGVLVGCIGFNMVYQPLHNYTSKYGKNLFINNWWNTSVYNVTGLLGFHSLDVQKFVNERVLNKKKITAEEIESVRNDIEARWESRSKSPLFGSQTGKNVLIVQTEAFQNFFIGKSINGKEITPNLNKLSKEVMYYDHFYHQVGQGRTVDAEFVVNNSLYPLPTGAVYREYPDGDYDSLPKVLKQQGYSTYAFHVYEKTFWNRHMMYEQYGLDYFYGIEDFSPGESVGWGPGSLGDDSMLQQMVDILMQKQEPFYAMAVTLSSHHPYTYIPEKYRTLNVGKLEGTLEGNYLHAVHYVDIAIGNLIERMKEENLWDNTIFMMYGDHDGAIGQIEQLGELLDFEADDLTALEFKHNVPLFLHVPGADLPGVHSQTAGMVDVTPTVLDLLGIPLEDKYYLGENLLSTQDRLVIFRNGSFTDGSFFYKSNSDGVLKNGVCYETASREVADVNACAPGYAQVLQELKLSDQIIYNKLIKRFKK